MNTQPRRRVGTAFTIVEVMIAVFIFGMVLTAVYSTWISILRGKKIGMEAAAEVQRSRIAIRTIEDALLSAQSFNQNLFYYAFMADTSGDMAALTLVSRLPASFPGVGRYGDQVVRRVSFSVRHGGLHGNELVMTQAPMLMDTNGNFTPYSLTLARNVTEFKLRFYDVNNDEWLDEWIDGDLPRTNLPALVQVTLAQGRPGGGSRKDDVVSRLVSVPAASVTADVQTQPTGGADGAGGGAMAPPAQLGVPR